MSNQCPYVYGYSQIQTARQNETQIAEKKVNETFGTQNVMALIVPKGDYISEKALLERLEREYHKKRIYLSVVEANRPAAALYESFGFRFTGERDTHANG
mgnify:FL=1